ncbi:MAG TPA: DedA family protein [Thermodesulfovibrionales bacterium]|nr:DedA family protein [Thermodesulfovibrionales bacterium]
MLEHFPYIGLFVLLILGGTGFFFPEDFTLIGCGLLIATSAIRPIPGLLVAYSGILTGDFISYYLGRRYGHAIVDNRLFRKIVSPARLSLLEKRFDRWGIPFVFIGGRLVGGVFLVAGIMRMPLLKFLIVDAISSLFTVAIWTGVGYAGGNSLDVIKKDISRVEHVIIFLAFVLISVYVLVRSHKYRRNRDGRSS